MISILFENTSFSAYHTFPDDGQKHAAVILIHEVWGLNDHIKNVADRLAQEGFNVLAPDLLSETGITQKVDQSIMKAIANPLTRDEAQKKLREAMAPAHAEGFAVQTVAKLKTAVAFILEDENVTGKVGVMGFCFGGTYSFSLAEDSRIRAAVPFYGHAPENLEEIKDISCPVLAFYGENDHTLMEQLPHLKSAMQQNGKSFRSVVYPHTGHAFFNDTNLATYNPEAARDAWDKALGFLRTNLG